MMLDNYCEFLQRKVCIAPSLGFEPASGEINRALLLHQPLIVEACLRGGRRAVFAKFGLGKTVMDLEIVRICSEHERGRGLIILPLGVRQEFVRDALDVLHWPDPPKFIRSIDEAGPTGVYLTNYETVRDGKIDPRDFVVVGLDEADVLRGFGGTKTFRELMATCAGDRKSLNVRERSAEVKYRFVFTATPSPNDHIELLAYAAFLGIMDVSQAKTRFFKRNPEKADELEIHPHKEAEFWAWVSTWAIFCSKPSDIDPSFSDSGYDMPPLDLHWHEIQSDHSDAGTERDGQGLLFRNVAIGVQNASKEKRDSMEPRIAKLVEIVNVERERARSESEAAQDSRNERVSAQISIGTVSPSEEHPGQASSEGISEALLRSESRTAASGTAPEGEGAVSSAGSEGKEGARAPRDPTPLRDDSSGFRGHLGLAGQGVRALSAQPGCGADVRRSLPQDGDGTRDSLHAVQCGVGPSGRRSGIAHGGSRISDQVVIWCDLNDEQRRIRAALSSQGISVSSLDGALQIEEREERLNAWRDCKTSVFLSKPQMYGAGVNLQQSHIMVFVGIGFKARDIIQACHRIHRFQQQHRCSIHFLYTEAEREVRRTLERKWAQHLELEEKMTAIIREHGLGNLEMIHALKRSVGVERCETSGENYRLVHNDCVLETAAMADSSVDLVLTSIPFSSQYEYSPNYADFGHSDNNAHFFQQMDYLTPQLLRVLKPGRIAAIHVKDRIVPMGMTSLGSPTAYPFHAKCIEHFTTCPECRVRIAVANSKGESAQDCRHRFAYLGMKTIVTDVVRENNQTYRLGWTEQCKDGTKMGVGMPEYLLLFRRPPTDCSTSEADQPVAKAKPLVVDADGSHVPFGTGLKSGTKEKRPIVLNSGYSRSRWQIDAHGYTRSSGNRALTAEDLASVSHDVIFKLFRDYNLASVYEFEHHVRLGESLEASGKLPVTFMLLQPPSWHPDVWSDVTRMLTLNGSQSAKGKEMHLCPMQFDLADRAIEQWSMPGELVYDPFAGLGTVPYRAVLKGRRGLGCELSTPYWLDSAAYCAAAEREMSMPDLFGVVT